MDPWASLVLWGLAWMLGDLISLQDRHQDRHQDVTPLNNPHRRQEAELRPQPRHLHLHLHLHHLPGLEDTLQLRLDLHIPLLRPLLKVLIYLILVVAPSKIGQSVH